MDNLKGEKLEGLKSELCQVRGRIWRI